MDKTETQKCVYLLVGQRGAGKSYYAGRLLTNQPELSLISRDDFLVRKFGSVHLSPYSSAPWYAQEVMKRLLRFVVRTRPMFKIVLDSWTEDSEERGQLIRELKGYGTIRVVALYFVTPREIVSSWFWRKPGVAKMSEMGKCRGENLSYFPEDAPLRDYDVFHRLAQDIERDGFDQVIRIDPQICPITLS